MGRTVLLLLALVAATQAGPIIDTVKVADSCATQCTESSKFNYKPGTTYEFQYDNEIRTAIQGASQDHAGIQVSAKVHMDFISKCELVMRLTDVSLSEHDPELKTMKPVSQGFQDYLQRNPIRASFQDGHIEHICLAAEEPTWVVNVKRGILSVFQNNMYDLQKEENVKETDVSGECEAVYSPGEKGWYNLVVKKSKNLLGCVDRQTHQTAIKGTPYRVPSEIQSLPLLKSDHNCEQEISVSTGLLTSAMCKEQHVFRPFSRHNSGASTNNTQTLRFVQEKAGISRAGPITKRVPLKFEHASDADMSVRSRKDLERKLIEVCQTTKTGVDEDTPRLFSDIVYIMKSMEADALTSIYQNIKSGALCSDNKDRVSKFFLDAIPMVGTSESVRLLSQMIVSNVVSGVEADMWLTTLAFIQKPTLQMIVDVKPLLSVGEGQGKAMLAVSSLVNSYCKENKNCENSFEVRNIITLLETNIGASCKVTDSNFKTVLLALRAIGNAGFATNAIPTLNSCMSQTANPIEVRLSAIEAFRRIPCNADKRSVMAIFLNKEEDSEVRIAAYRTVMECPTASVLSQVRNVLRSEEVNQVGSYVWSHLTNLMETSDIHKQDVRAILEDVTLQKEFDMDKRKFSRNYEGSLFFEKINTGAKAEADLIWSGKSFIPRSAMLNLTVDLFGESVNLFEVGGRVEGLEYFLESYFGPNGYFSENDVQAAADETALKTIRSDKVSRMEKRFGSAIDELRGNLYVRVFGNELRYMNFKGLDSLLSGNTFNFLEMLIQLSQNNDYTFSQSIMFLDSNLIIPTSSGFPMNLSINGTATVDLKASGKMDLLKLSKSPPTLDIDGMIKPSGAVEISSVMSVDAFVTRSGIKMVSTMHSSSSVQGRIQMSGGNVINAEWDLPQNKMELFSVRSKFFTVHREMAREQKMVTENRQTMGVCSGKRLSTITGLELCGELSFPNASVVADAPYFPMTGPVNMDITLHKRDTLTGYKLEARSVHNENGNLVRLALTTPGSKVDRDMAINMDLNKKTGTLDASLTSPWTKAEFNGAIKNQKFLKGISGKVTFDGQVLYMINGQVASKKSGPGFQYTPSLEIQRRNGAPVDIRGKVMFAAMKVMDVDITVTGMTKLPITVKGAIMNKPALFRIAGSYSQEKDKEYSFETRLQTINYKAKVAYKPTLSVRTPTNEVLAFGGGVTYAAGKQIDLDLLLDKIVEKPIKLKGKMINKQSKKKRQIMLTRMDFTSSLADIKLKSKLDNRNGKTIATDIDVTYNIRKVARNGIKLVSKVTNLSTKSLTKAKGTMTFEVKKTPELNLKVVGNVNHNYKHSDADIDVRYGANMKDEDRHIETSVMMNRALKSWNRASFDFDGRFQHPGMGLRMMTKLSHKHDSRNLASSMSAKLNKNSFSSSLTLKDQTKDLTNIVGELDLMYQGRSMQVTQSLIQSDASTYTSTMTAMYRKSTKHTIITTWNKPDPASLAMSSTVNIQGMEPLRFEGEYSLNPGMFKVGTSMEKGQSRYAASVAAQANMGKSLQVATDFECPTRRVVLNYEGEKKVNTVSNRIDLRWNADRDESQRATVNGQVTFVSTSNMNGSVALQYPGRKLSLNMRHLASNAYVSHIGFQWAPKKVVSADTSFRYSAQKGLRKLLTSVKLQTPFDTLPVLDISLGHTENNKEYNSNVDVSWNPSKLVSGTVVVRKPVSLSSIYASLVAKTPFSDIRKVNAELTHNFDGSLSTVGKLSWNKKSIQGDISFDNKGTNQTTNLKGQLDIKSTFPSMKKVIVIVAHAYDEASYTTRASYQRNKQNYRMVSEMAHASMTDGLESSGKLIFTSPKDKVQTTWEHKQSANDVVSKLSSSWGAETISIKYTGQQDMSFTQGTASSTFELQTPFEPIKDLNVQLSHEHRSGLLSTVLTSSLGAQTAVLKYTGQLDMSPSQGTASSVFELRTPFDPIRDVNVHINHEHRIGFIETNAVVSSDGMDVMKMEGTYVRRNGMTESSLKMSNPFTSDVVVRLNSAYKAYPMSCNLEGTMGQDASFRITGAMNRDINGNMNGTIQTASSLDIIDNLVLSAKKTQKNKETVAELEFQFGQGKTISLQTNTRYDSIKKIGLVLSSPFSTQIATEVRVQGTPRAFTTNAYIDAPVIKKWSMSSSWNQLNGLSGDLRINTPMQNVSYVQWTIDSSMIRGSRESSFTFEYQPGKIIRLDSNYKLEDVRDLAASMKLSTPFAQLPYTGIEFSHRGDVLEFNNNVAIEYQRGNKLQAGTSFSSRNGLEGTLVIGAPFMHEMSAAVRHTGNANSFQSHFEMVWDQKIQSDVQFQQLNGISADVAIETPFISIGNMKTSLVHSGDFKNFNTEVRSDLFGNRYTSNVKFAATPKVTAELVITTPHSGYENLRVAGSFDGTPLEFESQATITLGKSSVAGDMKLQIRPSFELKGSFETPFETLSNVKYALSHEGSLRNFTTSAEINHATLGKYVADVTVDTLTTMSGDISIRTSLKGYRNMGATLTHDGSADTFTTQAEVRNGQDKVNGQVKFTRNPMTIEATLSTPFSNAKRSRLSITHGGKLSSFKSHAELQINKALSTADLTVKALKKIDVDFVVKSPYMDLIKASFDHSGSLKKFNTKVLATYGKMKTAANVRMQFRPSINAVVSLKTPMKSLRVVSLGFKHSGNMQNFKTMLQSKYNGKTFVADGTFQNTNSMTGAVNMKGSYIMPIKMQFSHTGNLRKFQSSNSLSYGKKRIESAITVDTLSGITGSVSLRTPFSQVKNANLMLKLDGELGNFALTSECTINRQKGKADISFDSTNDLTASALIETPFEGFEDITATLNNARDIGKFSCDAQYTINGKKTHGTAAFNTETALSGSLSATSSYHMMKDIDASFSLTGNWSDFSHHAELSIAQDKTEMDIAFSMKDGIEGSASFNSPLAKRVSTGFKHTSMIGNIRSQAFVRYGSAQQFDILATLNNEREVTAQLSVKTPFSGFEKSELTVQHGGTTGDFRSRVEVLLSKQKHQMDVAFSAQRKVQGSFMARSPLFKTAEATFSYAGRPSNFESEAEVLYAKKSQLKMTASMDLENDMTGEFKLISPYMTNVRASFYHNGPITNFRNHFEAIYGGQKGEVDTSFNLDTPTMATITIKTPFTKAFEMSLEHTGPATNFRNHFEMTYGGEKSEITVNFNLDSSINAGFTMASPISKDIQVSFEHIGPITNCQTNIGVMYGGESQLSVSGRMNVESKVDGEFHITTPVQGFRNLVAVLKVNGNAMDFVSSSQFILEDYSIKTELAFKPTAGRLLLKSPFTEDLKGAYSFTGEMTQFQSNGGLSYGSQRLLNVECNMDLKSPMSGLITVTLPLKGYAMSKLAFQHTGSMRNFNSRVDLTFGQQTAEGIVSFMHGRDTKGSISLRSSFSDDMAATFNMDGDIRNFQAHTDVTVGQVVNAADMSFTMLQNIEGSLAIKPYQYQPIKMSFSHNGRMPNIRTHADLIFSGVKQLDVTVNVDTRAGLSGGLVILTPFENMRTSFGYEGQLTKFNARADASISDNKVEGDISFAIADKIEGRLNAESSLFEKLSAGFEFEGTPRNFQSHLDATRGSSRYETEVKFNAETAVQGSVNIMSPLMQDIAISFEHVGTKMNFRSEGTVSYGHETEFNVVAAFNSSPMTGNLLVRTPISGYEMMSAGFKHESTMVNFKSHAEFSLGAEKTEGDVSFDVGSRLGGSVSLRSPLFTDVSSEFRFSGNGDNFRSNSQVMYGSQKYAMNTVYQVSPTMSLTVDIETPLTHYRNMQAFLTKAAVQDGIKATAEISNADSAIGAVSVQYNNADKKSGLVTLNSIYFPSIEAMFDFEWTGLTIRGDGKIVYDSQVVTAKAETDLPRGRIFNALFKAPFVNDISTETRFRASDLMNMEASSTATYGEESVSVDASVSSADGLIASLNIKTPFAGFERMGGSVKHIMGRNRYTTNAEFNLQQQTIEMNSEISLNNPIEATVTLKTPFAGWNELTASIRHLGNFPNIKSSASFVKSSETYEIVAQLSHDTATSGKLTLTTPLSGYENFDFEFSRRGDISDIQADAKLVLPTGQDFSGSFENAMSSGKFETKATVQTPYLEDIVFDLRHSGTVSSFTTVALLAMGNDNSVSSITSFNSQESLDFSSSLSTTIMGKSDVQKVSFKHEGNLANFKNSAFLKLLGKEFNAESDFAARPNIQAHISLDTSFENARDMKLSFEHSGNLNRFSTIGEVQYALNKKVGGTIMFGRFGSRRLQASVAMKTPFEGFTNSKISYRHTGTAEGFECNAEANILDKSLTGSLRVAKSPVSAVLTINTPFEGFEQIGADMNLDYDRMSYSAAGKVTYMQGHAISVSSEANTKATPAFAHITVETPFPGFETSKIQISHSGHLHNSQSRVVIELPFTSPIELQSSVRYSSLFDVDASVRFNSQIKYMEALMFSLVNKEALGKYNSRIETSWDPAKTIVVDGSSARNGNKRTYQMVISTPFESVRQMKLNTESSFREDAFAETLLMQYNEQTILDYDLEFRLTNKKSASIQLRSPQPMKINVEGSVQKNKVETDVYINWDTVSPNKYVRFEGSFESTAYKTVSAKLTIPNHTVGLQGSLESTATRMQSSADAFWNNQHFGYDTTVNENDGKVKLILPTRSLEWSGSRSSRTTEGSFMWDADKDSTKRIGFRSAVFPSDDSTKVDLTLMMPSIGKDVQLDSEMVLNRGRVIFEGKTELTYSSDKRKKLSVTSRLEDISSGWSSKNYSFSLGVTHPFTSVGVQLSSHMGQSSDRLSAAVDVEYLTATRQTKTFNANGEINKLRRTVTFDVDTPIKKVSIKGSAQVNSPYRLALVNKYDNSEPISTVLTISPAKRLIDLSMNYDIENPSSEVHVTARYVNSSAVAAEVFHVVNKQRITDALLAMRLNNSHLLHNRLHWRPSSLADMQAYIQKASSKYAGRLDSAMTLVKTSLMEEMTQKMDMIGSEILMETEPLTIAAMEKMVVLYEMYETNEYHLKDMADAAIEVAEEARMKLRSIESRSEVVLSQMMSDVEYYMIKTNEIIANRTQMMTERITECMEAQYLKSNKLYSHYAEMLNNMTRHPRVVGMQKQYNVYLNTIKKFPIQSHVTNMADRYTSAMYNAREAMTSQLSGVMNSRVMQHGCNAYKYWEIRENAEAVAMAVYDWIREEIMEEVACFRDAIMNFENTTFTVFDPAHGEIQAEVYLPIPIKSLDVVPSLDVTRYTNKVQKYIPKDMTISLPSIGESSLLPPFEATAAIKDGKHVQTFDGKTFDLSGSCTYLLAKDFVDRNFSISLNNGENRTLAIFVDGKVIEINKEGQVFVNGVATGPVMMKNVRVAVLDGVVSVDGAGSFNVDYDKSIDLITIKLNGWYFGKTGGLLGSYDNEPSNDLMTSYGRPVDTVSRFARTWDIGAERCK